ncbi:MAG: hypothetical protein BMS9Abin26_1380 [Gammaproteobacteria bacterium]|nr:MAG: hypothetical protein BMS9Abin26_1380 [Gammaproteobacteria bacterium]
MLVNQLLHQAQMSPEKEICGLVAEKNQQQRIIPVNNVASDPQNLFEMEPKALIDAMRNIREADEQLFAVYHSHPQGTATPSALDSKQAEYPEALYLIIALGTKGVLELRGFRLLNHTFQSVDLHLV